MTEVIDTRRMPDGTEYRVRLLPDNDAEQPYDEGQWPILRMETRSNLAYYGYVATAFNQAATPYVAVFNELAQRGHNMEVFERYLRIFHGTTQVHVFGPERTRATDYTYIAFDAKEWHEAMGFLPNNVEALAKERPLAEIAAWIEGDVWGTVTETRWNPDEDKDEDDWEPQESVWGFYGRKYAEEAAKTELENTVQGHKYVHRYPEHEKLVAHETEVQTCLDLLESLEQGAGEFGYSHVLAAVVGSSPYNGNHLEEVPASKHQRLVYEHFRIDYKKIKKELDLMVQRLQEQEEASK